MHAQTPDTLLGQEHRERGRRGLAVVHTSRRAVLAGEEAAEEGLPARPHQQPEAEGLQAAEPGEERPVVLGLLGEPEPGSSTIRSSGMPAARAASTRWESSARTAATTPPGPSYAASSCMWSACPRQCMQTYVVPEAATTSRIRGSARPPETSLTIVAPEATACSATSERIVSTDTVAPPADSSRITGITRPSSSSTSGRVAPGRVDSPPMSRMSAPSANRSRPCAIAASGVDQRPPSEKESGVTLTTPISNGEADPISGRLSPCGW